MERLREVIIFQAENPQTTVKAIEPFMQINTDDIYVTRQLSNDRQELAVIIACKNQ
jgi:hypothetical protein